VARQWASGKVSGKCEGKLQAARQWASGKVSGKARQGASKASVKMEG